MKPLAALVTVTEPANAARAVAALSRTPAVGALAVAAASEVELFEGVTTVRLDSRWSSTAIREMRAWLASSRAEHLVWVLDDTADQIEVGRLARCARDSGAAITYSDYLEVDSSGLRPHPLIDYQPGSLRDDFDFGAVVLLDAARVCAATLADGLRFAGWYELRLRLSETGPVLRVPEPLYQRPVVDARRSGDKVFDYVDPRQRDYQIEMERVATEHLRRIGAWLPPPSGEPIPDDRDYAMSASVVIPVKNRHTTVGDAVSSALRQNAPFPFNVIVVDNHSDDGTTERLRDIAAEDDRLVHLTPTRRDLGIGGCWQHAIDSEKCGRFAVQLDSDDIYDGENVLTRIVAELERGCAMVVGSYTTVNFDLEPLPPGLVDHREWTDENGHNNALRIAGLGAPRAFHVPTLRTVGFPNVSYGEDYAVALRLCRSYRVGRIYDSLYWCRRWEGNTDSALPLETSNRYHVYKDRLRSIEIAARQARAAR